MDPFMALFLIVVAVAVGRVFVLNQQTVRTQKLARAAEHPWEQPRPIHWSFLGLGLIFATFAAKRMLPAEDLAPFALPVGGLAAAAIVTNLFRRADESTRLRMAIALQGFVAAIALYNWWRGSRVGWFYGVVAALCVLGTALAYLKIRRKAA